MKILLTGANGYIGTRLLPVLLDAGHRVVVLIRRPQTFDLSERQLQNLSVFQGDLLDVETLSQIPKDIEAAYYLVHSMSASSDNFVNLEKQCANNFVEAIKHTQARQIIYLSGISNDQNLSPHLNSRKYVEGILSRSGIPCTILRAAVIIGSGSASFEMIRDLVEKLPFMITPRWVLNKTQPIAISDVLFYLNAVLDKPEALNQTFEIGSEDQITYREMLLTYAKVRELKRYIVNVPVLTPRLSSYWLYFVTSTNFTLASSLVDSLRNETICKDFRIQKLIPHKCLSYEEAVRRALEKIEQNHVVSSWRDAISLSRLNPNLNEYINVPTAGCLIDKQRFPITQDLQKVIANIWSIGGDKGWYYANWVWQLRGFIDKLCGGAGLNRGRTHPHKVEMGDVIDFWRVLVADKPHRRLLLYAEMRMPGEAWLEFKVVPHDGHYYLEQTATFRPKGLLGRLYWYLLLPFHLLIFQGMARKIAET